MNNRENYIATVKFMTPEKIPFSPGGPREKTIKRWISEGLNPNLPWQRQLSDKLNLPKNVFGKWQDIGVDFKMNPTFEEKVLSHEDGHYIIQDWMGAITEISDEYDYTYIRMAKDFVTRKWHKFPVDCHEDFIKMKKRYNPYDKCRFPTDFKKRYKNLREKDEILSINFNGPFWQLREWVGFEGLCMMMIENPAFVKEMADFWMDFITSMLEQILETVVVDRVFIQEDMAYKSHSMISPKMTNQFLVPSYNKWVPMLKNAGVPVIEMDSDGYVKELIPIWIENNFDICSPVEVAANNDIVEFRELFNKDIAFSGGVDKRCIAKGFKVIEDEMARLAPIIKGGGYIPSCDHGVPHDISWGNFIEYSRILAELTGWL